MTRKELGINKGVTLSLGFMEILGGVCNDEETRNDLISMIKEVKEIANLIEDYTIVEEAEQFISLLEIY